MYVLYYPFYVKPWFKCPMAILTPYRVVSYARNIQISEAVIEKCSYYLWYLSDECVAHNWFDGNVSKDIKKEISEKITTLKSSK